MFSIVFQKDKDDFRRFLLSKEFIYSLSRHELFENKRSYLKAVRVTLISLGIDENFVNEDFREALESCYED